MNVRGAPADGIHEDHVHQADHRGLVGRFLQLEDVGLAEELVLALHDLDVGLGLLEFRHHVRHAAALVAVGALGSLPDRHLRGDDRLDLEIGEEGDVVQRQDIGGVGHGQRQDVAVALDGQDVKSLGELGRHQLEHLGIDVEVR